MMTYRPNTRRHPLDRHEEWIDDEEDCPTAVPIAFYALVLAFCLVSWGVVLWALL